MIWDEPADAGHRGNRLYQLSLRVRRYHEYADVEVKMIVDNAEKHRRACEEDVLEGDPEVLKDCVDEQIYQFTQLYVEGRGS